MRADDPRLLGAQPRGAGHAAGGRLRRGDRRPSVLQQRRAAARWRADRAAPQGLPADLRHVRRGPLHAAGRPDPDASRWGSRCGQHRAVASARTSGMPACRCSRRSTAPACSSTWPPARRGRPGSAAGLAAIGGWHKMQDTYALLGTVAVAFCNRVGNEEGLTFWGGSRLLGPDGSTDRRGAALRGGAGDRRARHRRPAHAALRPAAARRRAARARAPRARPDHRRARRACRATEDEPADEPPRERCGQSCREIDARADDRRSSPASSAPSSRRPASSGW